MTIKYCRSLFFIQLFFIQLFFLIIIGQTAVYATPGTVQNLYSTTHETDSPSTTTQITMSWSAPEGYTTNQYYSLFNNSSTHTFNAQSTEQPINETSATSEDYASVNPDDISYYFHIAAMDYDENDDEIFGDTVSYGPIRIDVVAPSNESVTAPTTTSNTTISLTLGATDAAKVYISNSGYGSGGELINYVTSRSWTLTDEVGTKTIYVQFLDLAGNTTNTSTTTYLCMKGDVNNDSEITAQDAKDAFNLYFTTSSLTDEQICVGDYDDDGEVDPQDAVEIFWKSLEE